MKIGYLYKDTSKNSEGFIWHEIQLLQELGFEVIVFVKQHQKQKELPSNVKIVKAFAVRHLLSISAFLCGWNLIFRSFLPALRLYHRERREGAGPILSLKRVYYAAHILPYKLDYLVYTFYPLVRQRAHIADAIGSKMVICLRGYDPALEARFLNKADRLFVRSEDLYRTALSTGLKSSVYHKVIPSSVDLNKVLFKPLIQRDAGMLSILSVGRAHWKKGYEYLLLGLKQLKDEKVNFNCKIIGAGEETAKLHFMIHQLGLSQCVAMLGDLPQSEVIENLYQSEVFIHSSISEGCSNVVLEAQAAGVFCIASNIPGNNIEDNKTGFVFDVYSPRSMANRVKDYLSLEDTYRMTLLENARAYIEAKYSFAVLSKNLQDFYLR